MKRHPYTVKVEETTVYTYVVEAEDWSAAADTAIARFEQGEPANAGPVEGEWVEHPRATVLDADGEMVGSC